MPSLHSDVPRCRHSACLSALICRAVYLLALGSLVIPSASPGLVDWGQGGIPAADTVSLTAHVESAPSATIFPSPDQVHLNESAALASFVSSALEYGPAEFVNSSTGDWLRVSIIDNITHASTGVYSVFPGGSYWLVAHNYGFGGSGSLGLYYNSGGDFIGMEVTMPANASRTTVPSQYAVSLCTIAASFGIPERLLATIEVWTENSSWTIPSANYTGWITEWFNYSVVLAYSPQALGFFATGCNALGLRYDNDTDQLISIEAWRFVELPSISDITAEEALSLAHSALPSHFYSTSDVVVREGVYSIRLDPETLRFGYQYEASVDIPGEDSSYFVLLLVDVDDGAILDVERTLPATESTVANPFPWLPVLLALTLVVVIVGLVGVYVSPDFAWLVMGSFLVLAYIRLRGANVLDNFNRGRIMGFISARPGASFTEIRDALRIVNGNLAYHLCVLEKIELISSSKQGRSRRFYPVGIEYSKDESQFIGRTESKILEYLDKNGPLSNSAIARLLGMSRQRTHYNLKLLHKRGLVDRSGSLWQIKAA